MTTIVGVARFEKGVAVVHIGDVARLENTSKDRSSLLALSPILKGCVDLHIRLVTDMGGKTSYIVESGAKVYTYKLGSSEHVMTGGSNQVNGSTVILNEENDSLGLIITNV